MALLAVQDLTVRYGPITALDRVSIEVAEGEVVALIGANGAGKTTLVRAIVGQVEPEAGAVRFVDQDLAGMPPWRRARRGIGVSPEGRRVFSGLTVRENLDVAAGCSAKDMEHRIADIFALFPALRGKEAAWGWQLSGGQQQMLAIGRALVGNPRLLVLDEPTLGLAPTAAEGLYSMIRRLAVGGRGILLADQNSAAALAVADRVYVLQTGLIIAEGTPAGLQGHPVITAAILGAS